MFERIPNVFSGAIRFYQRKEVRDFRKWFVRNSKIIAFFPVIYLTLNTLYYEDKVRELDARNKKVEKELIIFKEHSLGVFRTFDDIPKPIWSKLKENEGFVMLRTNTAYYDQILKKLNLTRNAYIGSSDYDIYPKHIADKFRSEDSFVSATGNELYTIDNFRDSLGGDKVLLVIKWRKIEKKDTLIMGQAIDLSPILKELREFDNKQIIEEYNSYGNKQGLSQ